MKRLILAVLAVTAIGCVRAPMFVLMRNDQGDLQRCEANAGQAAAWGPYGAKKSIADCVDAYEQAGYRRVRKGEHAKVSETDREFDRPAQ